MAKTLKEIMAAANAAVERLEPRAAKERISHGDALVLDVRDAAEVQASGKVKGAVNVSRGLLEFKADPDSPAHDPAFARDREVLVYCGSGGRAALAGQTLKEMGFERVYNVGGFKDLAEAGVETERG